LEGDLHKLKVRNLYPFLMCCWWSWEPMCSFGIL
jgi:hypothetical protein